MAIQDYFDYPVAYNPTAEGGSGALVPDAEFQVYAVDDTSFSTPLAVTEPVSGAAISPLKSSSVGVLPSFRVAGDPTEVIIRSGPFATRLASKYGIVWEAGLDPVTVQAAVAAGQLAAQAKTDAEAARAGAESAREGADEAARNAGDTVARVPVMVAESLADDATPAAAAAAAVGAELAGKNVPLFEVYENEDVYRVRFEDGEPFVEADEARGIFSRITHQPDSIGLDAVSMFVRLPPESGWSWAFMTEDRRAVFGQRSDGSFYPEIPAGPGSVTETMLAPNTRPRLWPAIPDTAAPVYLLGDSQTATGSGYGGDLAGELGVPVTIDAIGGHGLDPIAARQGGRPARVTLAGNTMPTSGPVAVTLDVDVLWRSDTTTGTISRHGTIMGVPGTLTRDNVAKTYSFTLDAPGIPQPVWVSPGTAFRPTIGAAHRQSLQVILAGRNGIHWGGYWTPDTLIGRLQQIVAHIREHGRRFLILELFPTHGDAEPARRARLEEYVYLQRETFPDEFVPTKEFLLHRALPLMGRTPTAQDETDIANGVIPTTLTGDGVHLNHIGNPALAKHVAGEIRTRGLLLP